jgi:hypothetical protein
MNLNGPALDPHMYQPEGAVVLLHVSKSLVVQWLVDISVFALTVLLLMAAG